MDDLSTPLGQGPAPKRGRGIPHAVPHAIAGALSLFVVLVVGWAMVAEDPFGGEPMVVAPAELAANPPRKPDDGGPRPVEPRPASPAADGTRRYDGPALDGSPPPTAVPGRTVTIIDGSSGKRQEVVLPGPADRPDKAAKPDKPDKPDKPAKPDKADRPDKADKPDKAEKRPADIDQRVTETSRHGPLPKVAADGARAADVYAKPPKAAGKPNTPRIALVVGGLGIGAAVTNEALKLPGPVTLAFPPYGGGLDQLAARARSGGHEVLLQVPMEPFDYPENDPGPQALLTALDSAENIDRLQWAMSRFQGYVGIANFMGARFTTSEPALAPVLKEAGKRGLIFFDDGASQRSVARQIAGANNVGFAKADLAIDAVPTAADIDRALGRLEIMARERGLAVGTANALPVAIERIAKWAKAAEARGVQLVPITTVAKQASDDKRQTTENRTTEDAGRKTE